MAHETKKMMPEIPLGFSLVREDTDFILYHKQANGDISAMNLSDEEFWKLLTVATPSGEQLTLELPPHVAKYIADEVLWEIDKATKH